MSVKFLRSIVRFSLLFMAVIARGNDVPDTYVKNQQIYENFFALLNSP